MKELVFYRINTLAKRLHLNVNKVVAELTLKGQGRFYYKYQDTIYAVKASKELYFPYPIANQYANKLHKSELPLPVFHKHFPIVSKYDHLPYHVDTKVAVLLGHFNHGKTSLLDALLNYQSTKATPQTPATTVTTNKTTEKNKSNLVESEKHGITQEVRTKLIKLASNQHLTIVDTPGQEIFYGMRNIGSQLADIGILLVSIEDGICQQTQESIGILESLQIPAIVCVNKIDLLDANQKQQRISRLTKELRKYIALEHAPIIPISATTNENIDRLINIICQTCSRFIDPNAETNMSLPEEIKQHKNILTPQTLHGRGIIINIVNHASISSQLLHVLVTEGQVQPGDFISAGGWSGRIIAILSDQEESSPLNKSPNKPLKDLTYYKGQAIKLKISYDANISHPRPLHDRIHFYSAKQFHDQLTNKEKNKFKVLAQEEAYEEMDQHIMTEELPTLPIISEFRERYQVDRVFQKDKLPRHHFYYHYDAMSEDSSSHNEENEETDDLSNETTDNETSEEEQSEGEGPNEQQIEEIEEDEDKNTWNIVVKASSDLDVNTIIDSFEDISQKTVNRSQAKRLVYTGTGNVTMHDFSIAKAAKGTILAYNVGIEKNTMLQIKTHQLNYMITDKLQDIVDFLAQETKPTNQK